MKHIILYLLAIPAIVGAQDNLQYVISSAGETQCTDEIIISWTLGEVATETISENELILS